MADYTKKRGKFNLIFVICFATACLCIRSCAEPTSDKQALTDFWKGIDHSFDRIRWNTSISACNWTGVVCDSTNTRVLELRLPGAGLFGQIPDDTIGRLTKLRALSLRSNRILGSVPADFENLKSLRVISLNSNMISGEFPKSLTRLMMLNRIDLSSNQFQGGIPESIGNLPLRSLLLQNNGFSGGIPSTLNSSGSLTAFNVSNNDLSGEIPEVVAKFPNSSFSGNLRLCGQPLQPCSRGPPPPIRRQINLAVVASIVIVFLLSFSLFAFLKYGGWGGDWDGGWVGGPCPGREGEGLKKPRRLVFFEKVEYSFELEDLFKAAAEVLGKGSMGTSFKAVLDDDTTVVVKRLVEVVVGKNEFDAQMALLGRIRHPNVVRLIGYYSSQEEKLLIHDYLPSGSLYTLLHGSRKWVRELLDWRTRFRIGLTAARGLHHIHIEAKKPHGNIKSSNILVTESREACISDYCMNSLFVPCSAMPNQVTGYRPALEVSKNASFKSDVYSFGVVLLELLTGIAPSDGVDLPRWVRSATSAADQVFYADPVRSEEVVEEMGAVLEVAMKCVDGVAEKRPGMGMVLRMLKMVERGEFRKPMDHLNVK